MHSAISRLEIELGTSIACLAFLCVPAEISRGGQSQPIPEHPTGLWAFNKGGPSRGNPEGASTNGINHPYLEVLDTVTVISWFFRTKEKGFFHSQASSRPLSYSS